MLQHYSHVRLDAKRSALDALSTKRADASKSRSAKGSYDTSHDTKQGNEAEADSQVVENMVELVGIELLRSVDNM